MSDRTIPSAATILASENDFLRRENIRLREVINARFIKYSNMDSERDALAARLEIAEAERNDALRASMKDMARLAEADKLLDDAKVWVPAFAGDLMMRIYDYFARCKQMQTIRTDRENERG